jgi:HKD family nuclease
MDFIAQPFGDVRLGDFLQEHLADPQWTVFRAAVAFVKRSGTQHIRLPLLSFSARAQVVLSVGVDFFGTSREALTDLLDATPGGQVFVYRNNGPYTFHPKVYLFKSAQKADVLVGSGNLTEGGLFTNYEASVVTSLDLTIPTDVATLGLVESVLDTWSQPQENRCYQLTPEFLETLVASGLVRTEAQLQSMKQSLLQQTPPPTQGAPTSTGGTGSSAQAPQSPFTAAPVPPPPPVPAPPPVAALPTTALPTTAPTPPALIEESPEAGEEPGPSEILAGIETPTLVLSVLAVDLPVDGSSNEITPTKGIRNLRPQFWAWPDLFEGPDATTGQYRRGIVVRYGNQIVNAYLQDFPARKPDGTKASADFRIGAIAPIVGDLVQEDDLVIFTQSDEPNVDYEVSVVRVGEPQHETLMNGTQNYTRSRSANGTVRKFRYIP